MDGSAKTHEALSGTDREATAAGRPASYGRRAVMIAAAAAGAGAGAAATLATPARAAEAAPATVESKSGFVAQGGGGVTTGYGTHSSSLAFGANVVGDQTGVVAQGGLPGAAGVQGRGMEAPGGVFSASQRSGYPPTPQIQLVPQPVSQEGGTEPAPPPLQYGKPSSVLPAVAEVGDMLLLLNTVPPVTEKALLPTTLWICVVASEPTKEGPQEPKVHAQWCQVLLGAEFPGNAIVELNL
jgi:hypothetical protein